MFKETYNAKADTGDPASHQGGLPAYSFYYNSPQNSPALTGKFNGTTQDIHIKRLTTAEELQAFFDNHTYRRITLPQEQSNFMKELSMDLLKHLTEKDMHVIGVFAGDQMVSGCAILYPADKDIETYLSGYDFNGKKDVTAVVSAVWTHPDHGGKGYSKKAVMAGLELATLEGKRIFCAKADKHNKASLSLFQGLGFDITRQGQDTQKNYPVLAVA